MPVGGRVAKGVAARARPYLGVYRNLASGPRGGDAVVAVDDQQSFVGLENDHRRLVGVLDVSAYSLVVEMCLGVRQGLANNSLIRTTATTRPRMTRRSVAPHRPTARRYVRLGTVHLVEVDGVGAQAAQRIFELGDDPAARDAAVAGVVAPRKNGEPHALHE